MTDAGAPPSVSDSAGQAAPGDPEPQVQQAQVQQAQVQQAPAKPYRVLARKGVARLVDLQKMAVA